MQKISYRNKYRRSHQCQSLVIRCMDFRFNPYVLKLLNSAFKEQGGIGSYDSRGSLGGSRAIVNASSRKLIFSAIDIAVERHCISRIIIIDHVDCGAYGGSKRFANNIQEEKFHIKQLKKAREIILKKYPKLEVYLFYQSWNTFKPVEG